ncbi:hypothetical protein JK359_04155 [Streptomyces actinomycinicus]|uniref:Uncharacterized protein n=1 Tax=Streptomyces actinomycinicus TaxID=1695166 RepID=A0A937JLB8_9ACTN|nr:hypothetical protein [Streptomyces actinomycinicus]MBL1081176.1 hypothetical protein [Streptomyces actinomycinicus]
MLRKTSPDVPRWAVRAAYAVPLITLPSGLWRIALAAGLPVTSEPVRTGWGVAYVLVLTAVTEGLALLTLGLVQPWGEVVPRWIPVIGGRPVHPLAAVVPALVGASLLFALSLLVGFVQGGNLADGALTDTRAQSVLLVVCYTPLLAWAPLLAVSAVAYHRRRRSAPASVPEGLLEHR